MTALAANRTSVPQVWINRKHVGGCDDLKVCPCSYRMLLMLIRTMLMFTSVLTTFRVVDADC